MPFATIEGEAPSPQKRGKDLGYLQLFDAYGPLLTETQQEICNLYFMCDLSLSEIAEEKGITKQAVSDTLKKSRELLDSFEQKLHFVKDNEQYALEVSLMLTRVQRALAELSGRHPEISKEVGAIADMVCVGEVLSLDEEE